MDHSQTSHRLCIDFSWTYRLLADLSQTSRRPLMDFSQTYGLLTDHSWTSQSSHGLLMELSQTSDGLSDHSQISYGSLMYFSQSTHGLMDFSQTSYRLLMNLSWNTHGLLMDHSQTSHGPLMDSSQTSHRPVIDPHNPLMDFSQTLMDFSWTSHGLLMNLSWNTHGLLMDFSGPLMDFSQTSHEPLIKHSWTSHGPLKTSHGLLTDFSWTLVDFSWTTHRLLWTSHRLLTDSIGLLMDSHRLFIDHSQTSHRPLMDFSQTLMDFLWTSHGFSQTSHGLWQTCHRPLTNFSWTTHVLSRISYRPLTDFSWATRGLLVHEKSVRTSYAHGLSCWHIIYLKLYNLLIVRELESRIHDVLFEVGTTPVMQATSESADSSTTQPAPQIRQRTTDPGGGGTQHQTVALGGSSGGQRGAQSGDKRWRGGSSVVTSNSYCRCHVAMWTIAIEVYYSHLARCIAQTVPFALRTANRLALRVSCHIILPSTPIAIKICRSAYAIIFLTMESIYLNFRVVILKFYFNTNRKLCLSYFRSYVWHGIAIISKEFRERNHLEAYIFYCFLSYYDHMNVKSHHPCGTIMWRCRHHVILSFFEGWSCNNDDASPSAFFIIWFISQGLWILFG